MRDDEIELVPIWNGSLRDESPTVAPPQLVASCSYRSADSKRRVPMAVTRQRILCALTRRVNPMTVDQIVDEAHGGLNSSSVHEILRGLVREQLVEKADNKKTCHTGRHKHTYRLTVAGRKAALSLRRETR